MSKSPIRRRYHSIRPSGGLPLTGKDILVFCDGTGKDGKNKSTGNEPPTNIWRLYQLAIDPGAAISGGRQKEIVYLPGIGSGSFKNPMNILSQLFGTTIVENIVAAYLHIAKHYEARDGIHLFGYSRGAFVARKVASLIYRIGIVRTEEELLKLWSQHERPVPWNLFNSEPRGIAIPIESLVVWDTIGAIQTLPTQKKMELDILGMPDEELPPNVKHAFHAVAFHENRKLFRATLFKPKSPEDSERLKEVWFPGAHSDVGGGSDKIDLSNITLVWVLGELHATCSLAVPHMQLDYPELDKLTPSDAYHESPAWKRIVDKCETRISMLKPTSFVHETILFLRNSISSGPDPRSNPLPHMLTLDDLMKAGWDIKTCVAARNAFEVLKQATASAQRIGGHCRSRIMSLHIPGTPRLPMNAINQLQNIRESILGSRPPSVAAQTRSPSATPPLLATHLHPEYTRSRAESHFIPRLRDIPSEQAELQPTLAVVPPNEENEATSGTPPACPPSTSPHTAALVRATSTRPRAESHAAPPTRPTSPEHLGQTESDPVRIEAPRPRRIAVSSILSSSRPGTSIPPGTRLRTESLASPSLSTIPSRQAVHHLTFMEVPQHDRNTMSLVNAPSRSDFFNPTTHIRTFSTRSRVESRAAPRPYSTFPVEAAPIPCASPHLLTIPSGQGLYPAPMEIPQHGRKSVSPVGVTSHSNFTEPRSPAGHMRTFSTRSRTESRATLHPHSAFPVEAVPIPSAGLRLPTTPSEQSISHPVPIEVSRHSIPAISPVNVTSSSDFTEPRSPTHVRTASTHSRTESPTALRHSIVPAEAVPFPSFSPCPPSRQAMHGRDTMSLLAVPSRSDFRGPLSPTTHAGTISPHSPTGSHDSRSVQSISPVEAAYVTPITPPEAAVPWHGRDDLPPGEQYITSRDHHQGSKSTNAQFKEQPGGARSWTRHPWFQRGKA